MKKVIGKVIGILLSVTMFILYSMISLLVDVNVFGNSGTLIFKSIIVLSALFFSIWFFILYRQDLNE